MLRCAPDNEGPRALVTGANSGIGFEACRQLALSVTPRINKIVLACRNEEKAAAAVARLVELTERDANTFSVLVLDMLTLSTVRAAAKAVKAPIAYLLLNAGGAPRQARESAHVVPLSHAVSPHTGCRFTRHFSTIAHRNGRRGASGPDR